LHLIYVVGTLINLIQIYIVYMGEHPKGMERTESLHTITIQSVITRSHIITQFLILVFIIRF